MAYILSLFYVLLMIHWIHSFSLYSFFNSSKNKYLDNQNFQSIDYQLPLLKRLRRWNKNKDNDEIEIPLNETIISVNNNSDDISTLDTIINSTLLNSFQIIGSNSSIIEIVDQFNNSINMTTFDIYSNENTTMKYPLLQQDLSELNQILNSTIEDNTTIFDPLLQQNLTELNQTSISTMEDNTTMIDPLLRQALTELNQTIVSTIENHTTIFDPLLEQNLTELNQTNISTIEDNTTMIDPLLQQTLTELNQTIVSTIEDNTTMTDPLLRQDLNALNQTIASIVEDNSTVTYSILRQNLTALNQTSFSIIEDNTTMIDPLLRQGLIELNETIISTIEDNTTVFNEVTYINESESVSNIFNQTTDSIEPTISIIHSNYINTTENNHNNGSNLLLNDTFTATINDELFMNSNISNKNTLITNQEINLNDTEIVFIETNQYFNDTSILTSKSVSIPICDQSCQCLKECPYGFEILNDTCICNPPCKNYQCFGNDTCIVTDQGAPLCQPENGIEHDRPIRCYQPRDAGYHDNNIRYYNRWYYNPDQDTCHLFVYRGLGGNENNFQTLHECHLECITCAPLPDPGECLGHINMWYYSKKENKCQEFQYSGCKGNENKFLKKEQCINTCIDRIINP